MSTKKPGYVRDHPIGGVDGADRHADLAQKPRRKERLEGCGGHMNRDYIMIAYWNIIVTKIASCYVTNHTCWVSSPVICQLNFAVLLVHRKRRDYIAAWTFELSPRCTLASESAHLTSSKKRSKVRENSNHRSPTSSIAAKNFACNGVDGFWAGGLWKWGWKWMIFSCALWLIVILCFGICT